MTVIQINRINDNEQSLQDVFANVIRDKNNTAYKFWKDENGNEVRRILIHHDRQGNEMIEDGQIVVTPADDRLILTLQNVKNERMFLSSLVGYLREHLQPWIANISIDLEDTDSNSMLLKQTKEQEIAKKQTKPLANHTLTNKLQLKRRQHFNQQNRNKQPKQTTEANNRNNTHHYPRSHTC
jgi:hypothetical protein